MSLTQAPCFYLFFFNDTATTEIYTLSLHDALPISAHTADDANRRQRRFDDREAQLGVGEHDVLAHEGEVIVSAHLRVAAHVQEVGEVAHAPETADARREHAAAAEPHVMHRVGVDRLARQRI